MALVVLVLLLAVPVAELYVLIQLGHAIGALNAVALLVVISVLGAVLVKHQGLAVWRRLNEQIARGQVPTDEITDGFLVLLAGAFLLAPGFLSDVVGLLLLLPPVRVLVRRTVRRRYAQRVTVVRSGSGGARIVTDVIDAESWENPGAGGPTTDRKELR